MGQLSYLSGFQRMLCAGIALLPGASDLKSPNPSRTDLVGRGRSINWNASDAPRAAQISTA